MRHIAEYQILTGDTCSELQKEENDAIKDGWQPQGGVSLAYSDFYSEDHRGFSNDNQVIMFAQAVVRIP